MWDTYRLFESTTLRSLFYVFLFFVFFWNFSVKDKREQEETVAKQIYASTFT